MIALHLANMCSKKCKCIFTVSRFCWVYMCGNWLVQKVVSIPQLIFFLEHFCVPVTWSVKETWCKMHLLFFYLWGMGTSLLYWATKEKRVLCLCAAFFKRNFMKNVWFFSVVDKQIEEKIVLIYFLWGKKGVPCVI